jgi:hypothetical protein
MDLQATVKALRSGAFEKSLDERVRIAFDNMSKRKVINEIISQLPRKLTDDEKKHHTSLIISKKLDEDIAFLKKLSGTKSKTGKDKHIKAIEIIDTTIKNMDDKIKGQGAPRRRLRPMATTVKIETLPEERPWLMHSGPWSNPDLLAYYNQYGEMPRTRSGKLMKKTIEDVRRAMEPKARKQRKMKVLGPWSNHVGRWSNQAILEYYEEHGEMPKTKAGKEMKKTIEDVKRALDKKAPKSRKSRTPKKETMSTEDKEEAMRVAALPENVAIRELTKSITDMYTGLRFFRDVRDGSINSNETLVKFNKKKITDAQKTMNAIMKSDTLSSDKKEEVARKAGWDRMMALYKEYS